MKVILLTKKIEDLADDYFKTLFKNRRTNFVKPEKGLDKLLTALKANPILYHKHYVNYVRYLIKNYNIVCALKPGEFASYHRDHFGNPRYNNANLNTKMDIGGQNIAFYQHISTAMRYDAVRDMDFLPYAKKLRIRSCVYCNANYAHSIKDNGKHIGKFELDHFFPQSKYPYLCTNFYNLYPVCGNCNRAKLDKPASFCLYCTSPSFLDPFSFSLDKASIIRFMLTQNYEDLKITFNPGTFADHETTFKIQAIYDVLKDVAEELIWKHKIYSDTYLKGLNEAFSKKFNVNGFNRFIIGNYDRPEDIHQRPLSKFAEDIAKQLGIIK